MNKKKSLIITSVVCILPLIAGVIMLGKASGDAAGSMGK